MTGICSEDLYQSAASSKLSDSEVVRRTSINRSYYAAFHDLSDKLEVMTSNRRDFGKHGRLNHGTIARLLKFFRNDYPDKKVVMSKGAEALQMYSKFTEAMKNRELCDYDLGKDGALAAHPVNVVKHFGCVDRLRGFAARLP